MDSGLGSDDDHRGRTKEQKQLHNQLLSGCLINDEDFNNSNETHGQRRTDERRQGALLFQGSIPQFSMLQISEPCDDNNFSLCHNPSAHFSETDTPYNSIEIEPAGSDEPETVRRSPLGFYVDLSEVTEINADPSSSNATTKNIFSMVIDFEGPKKEKPVKLSSSLASHRKKILSKSKLLGNDPLRPSSSTSSVNSDSTASTSKHSHDKEKEPKSLCKVPNLKLFNSSLVSVSSQSSSSSEYTVGKNKEELDRESPKDLSDDENLPTNKNCESLEIRNLSLSDVIIENGQFRKKNKTEKIQTCSQFVKLSDLECQESRIELNFTPHMSRSIPESSWVESPLLMCHSLGFRSAPHPIEPESHNEESEQDTTQPKKFQNKLGTDLLRMFLEEIGPDVTVEVEGHKLKAHKCILASRCQYFAALLSGNWLEKNGNIISLKGFSYESVYFALCHIYSGTMHVPDSISLVELASLADMLCLEGLKEVVEHALKQRHCHNFHKPCAGCCTGVLEVLPLSAAYGLEDLYQRCLQWITQHFIRVWPSRAFASLPRELREKCYQQHVLHMNADKVLETILACDKILTTLPTTRWVEPISRLVVQLADACHLYHRQHYAAVLGSHYFLNLNSDSGFAISQIEEQMILVTKNLGVEQACRSYSRCCKMLEQEWNKPFADLLNKIKVNLEQCLVQQADKLIRSNAWLRLDTSLRNRIKELTPNVEPASRLPRATLTRPTKSLSAQKLNMHSSSISSSDSSRNSSPGMNQKGRLNASTNGNSSLRRSLLLAAKAPQVPPSPLTTRKSTLTRPTAASTAKATQARNAIKAPQKNPIFKEPIMKSPVHNGFSKQFAPKRSTNVTRNPNVGKKNTPSALPKKINSRSVSPLKAEKKPESRASSPLKCDRKPDSRASSPLKTDRQLSSPRLSSPRKVDSRVTSPLKSNSSSSPFKPGKTSSPKQTKANNQTTEPIKTPVMQRSSTFLKDEPTVLGKIL